MIRFIFFVGIIKNNKINSYNIYQAFLNENDITKINLTKIDTENTFTIAKTSFLKIKRNWKVLNNYINTIFEKDNNNQNFQNIIIQVNIHNESKLFNYLILFIDNQLKTQIRRLKMKKLIYNFLRKIGINIILK